jgi:hypothetical protein
MKQNFLRISEAKIKEWISVAPKLEKSQETQRLIKPFSEVKNSLMNIKLVATKTDFLPIFKAVSHKPLEEFLSSYKTSW